MTGCIRVVNTQVNDTTTRVVNYWVQAFQVPQPCADGTIDAASDVLFRHQLMQNYSASLTHCELLFETVLDCVQIEEVLVVVQQRRCNKSLHTSSSQLYIQNCIATVVKRSISCHHLTWGFNIHIDGYCISIYN